MFCSDCKRRKYLIVLHNTCTSITIENLPNKPTTAATVAFLRAPYTYFNFSHGRSDSALNKLKEFYCTLDYVVLIVPNDSPPYNKTGLTMVSNKPILIADASR